MVLSRRLFLDATQKFSKVLLFKLNKPLILFRPILNQNRLISSRQSNFRRESATSTLDSAKIVESNHVLPRVKHKSKAEFDHQSSVSEMRRTPLSLLTNIAECNTEFSRRSTDEDSIYSMKTQDLPANLVNLTESPSPTNKSQISKTQTIGSSKRRVLKPLGALTKNSASSFLSELKSPPIESPLKTYDKLPEISNSNKTDTRETKDLRLSDTKHDSIDRESYKKLDWARPQSVSRVASRHITKPKSGTGHRPSSKTYRKTPESRTSTKVVGFWCMFMSRSLLDIMPGCECGITC